MKYLLYQFVRRCLGPDPELESQIDSLAHDRDQLQRQISHLKMGLAQQRQEYRAQIRSAYEPAIDKRCQKVRYLHKEDADQHAIQLAVKDEGEAFRSYSCRFCPEYRGFYVRPWHVATALSRDQEGAM